MVLSYFSLFSLTRTIIWVSFSLFICILSCFLPRSLAFLSPSPALFYLPGTFGPMVKNQPSRAFDDKQARERAHVSHIIYVCRPLELSSVSQKKTSERKRTQNVLHTRSAGYLLCSALDCMTDEEENLVQLLFCSIY